MAWAAHLKYKTQASLVGIALCIKNPSPSPPSHAIMQFFKLKSTVLAISAFSAHTSAWRCLLHVPFAEIQGLVWLEPFAECLCSEHSLNNPFEDAKSDVRNDLRTSTIRSVLVIY